MGRALGRSPAEAQATNRSFWRQAMIAREQTKEKRNAEQQERRNTTQQRHNGQDERWQRRAQL